MENLELLADLHLAGERQGPGGDTETKLALQIAGVDREAPLKVADLGCGTGASTMVLATSLNATITAVDLIPAFLGALTARARNAGVDDRINTLAASIDDLPFSEAEFDIIWSEGAIYNIGFKTGVAAWHRFLKPGGLIVASEITWTTETRPAEIQQHWESEYPGIDTASAKLNDLEKCGYSPIGFFILPEHCWLQHYYEPLQSRFDAFVERHSESTEARAIVTAERQEIELYNRYKDYFSYGVYLARKT